MSKETIKQAAAKLFASTTHNELWANPKGEFFTSENIGEISLKKGEILTRFERTDDTEGSDDSDKPMHYLEAIATIKAAAALEDLKPFETDERKSVKAAHDEQHAKLLAEIEAKKE